MKSVQFNNKYNKKLHEVKSLSVEEINNIINLLNNKQCNIFPLIKVKERIGSDSLHATVWKIEVDEKQLALKIQSDDKKSLNEIEINSYLNNWPSHFINYYGNLYCNDINIYDQKFSCYFIFLELAIGDLAQYLLYNKNITEKKCLNFVLEVLDSIYILGKNQIYHGDLHIRNIFITRRYSTENKNIVAVIGDFGESKGIDSITAHTSDIYKFSTSLLEFLNLYPQFNKWNKLKKKLYEVISYINKRSILVEQNYEKEYDTIQEINYEKYENLEELDKYFEKVVADTIKDIKEIFSKYF